MADKNTDNIGEAESAANKTCNRQGQVGKKTKAELVDLVMDLQRQLEDLKMRTEPTMFQDVRTSTPYPLATHESHPPVVTKNLKIPTFDGVSKHIRAKEWIRSYQTLAEDYNWPQNMMVSKLFLTWEASH